MELGSYDAELRETAARLSDRGRGILASDESTGTVGKRLVSVGLENNETNRRDFRELFYTAPGIGNHISGAIMFHETLYQACEDGTSFVDALRAQNVLPGIKVDRGLKPIPRLNGETYTEGMDGLAERCQNYYAQGARFAKWRAVLKIDPALQCPSSTAIESNAIGLALYAAIAQANGLMPIVEPEILIDGNHPIDVSASVAAQVISAVYQKLHAHRVILEGTLLKPQVRLENKSMHTFRLVLYVFRITDTKVWISLIFASGLDDYAWSKL